MESSILVFIGDIDSLISDSGSLSLSIFPPTELTSVSMNDGIKNIIGTINESSTSSSALSDFRKEMNSDTNGKSSSLGEQKLALINKDVLSIFQELGYFKDTFYGIPVGIYGSI